MRRRLAGALEDRLGARGIVALRLAERGLVEERLHAHALLQGRRLGGGRLRAARVCDVVRRIEGEGEERARLRGGEGIEPDGVVGRQRAEGRGEAVELARQRARDHALQLACVLAVAQRRRVEVSSHGDETERREAEGRAGDEPGQDRRSGACGGVQAASRAAWGPPGPSTLPPAAPVAWTPNVSMIPPRTTRTISIGRLRVGGAAPIAVQSMAATPTRDREATLRQIRILEAAGADLIRIAVDSRADVEALVELRGKTSAVLSVDLQESYRLAEQVAPHVDKIRYNPGHLHHHERSRPVEEKVAWIVEQARRHGCAIRIGVNAGSIAPSYLERFGDDHVGAIVQCAADHCAMIDAAGFSDYLVSIKDSDPRLVVDANVRFAQARPDVPLHLGVTEAGMPPEGIIKTRIAFEQLLARGLGDTLRVSLTVPFDDKGKEIEVGRELIHDVENGRFRSVPPNFFDGLNIIACPSCSRVENERFIELAEDVKRITADAKEHDLTIAVMGCRVNGPGETDDADLGLWCGPTTVNLKRGPEEIGAFRYDEILPRLRAELEKLIAERARA